MAGASARTASARAIAGRARPAVVEQHEPRLEHQRARHGDPLLLAAGELLRAAVGQPVEPHIDSARATLIAISAPDMPRTLSGKPMFSPTVMFGNSA